MRDRLIKLLQDNSYLDVLDDEHWLLAAEQLLANGVVVIDTDVVSMSNRPLISQYMGRPIDEVINLIRRSEWISVENRLPRSEQMVLCYTPCDGFMFVGFYREVEPNPYWKSYWNIITAMRSTKKMTKKVTHWMPLPEPPKGGAE